MLQDRVVVVTGAGRGIGRASAVAAGRLGARVVACDVDGSVADATAKAITDAGGDSLGLALDASTPEGADRLIGSTCDWSGRVDALICAGMRRVYAPAEEMADSDWSIMMEQGLSGYFRCAQRAGRRMIEQDGGSIVFITSIAGRLAVPGAVAYASVKAGVAGLTRQLGVEWASRGVRVNAIAPGPMLAEEATPSGQVEATRRTGPVREAANPQDIAAAAIFLLSDGALNITGQEIVIDGGMSAGRGFTLWNN